MDIHFSDEEDYNSDIDDSNMWDEETEIKGAASKSKEKIDKDSKEDDADMEEEVDMDDGDEVDIEEGDEADADAEEVDMDDGDEGDGDDGDGDDGDVEYYPEEDGGEMEEIIVAMEDRITSDILSKYEIVELISIRATQISKGDKPFTDVESLRDPIAMAKKELYDNRCPLLVKRGVGNNMYEYWNPNYMSKPKI